MGLVDLGCTAKQEEAYRLRRSRMSLDEIGRRMGIKKAAVSTLLARARQKAAERGVVLERPRSKRVRVGSLPTTV